jgi:2-keto-4-pentenoate hydratase/2-oxohepta-3-ene-1,7-dioic acid hydratase in catechol pathway
MARSDKRSRGIVDSWGKVRDLSGFVPDLAGEVLSDDGLAKIAAIDLETLPEVSGKPRLGAPVAGTRNFVCIGLNYSDHAAETGAAVPSEPIVFLKSLSALCGPEDDILIPRGSKKTDWEAELAIVIGKTARSVREKDALSHIAGYTVCNDVSEREWQNERGGAWDKGKGFDSFGPLGPWLVTRDEVPKVDDLAIFLDVDGERMQTGNTSKMIFEVPQLVAYVSQCITLYPGDIISTGTPPGVGLGKKPQRFLQPGSTVRLGLAGLGEQIHKTRAADR